MKSAGFAMIIALVFSFVLAAMAMALVYFISTETRAMGSYVDDTKLLYIAQAGVDKALREIRDDVLTTTQAGVADLRGDTTSGTAGSATTRRRVRYYNESSGVLTLVSGGAGTYVILSDFDLNYLGARIKNVRIGCRYRKSSLEGTNPSMEILYTTNGAFPEPGNSSFTAPVGSANFNAEPFIVLDITADRSWNWSVINNSDFQIRARGLNSSNRNVFVDYLFLQLTYETDTNTEAWYTGAYASYPISVGDGTIESVSVTDEAGKVHLNHASWSLLSDLMRERGIPGATADTLATNILNYRAANWFDSVEELQQVAAMTQANYALLKGYVTVYPFINASATRPSGSRAPVNINTAPREVLEAIFDPLGLGLADAANLATDIINRRTTAPFSCFYSSDSAVTSDFYDFVNGRAYLTAAERSRVLDNADASPLIPVAGAAAYDAVTTEFCYCTNAFAVEAVGKVEDMKLRVKTFLKDDGSRIFSNYDGDTTLTGYWRQSYE